MMGKQRICKKGRKAIKAYTVQRKGIKWMGD